MESLFDNDEVGGWDVEDTDEFLDDFPEAPVEPFEFFGNQAIIAQINAQLVANRLPHALLFAGEKGVGKFTLAQALAHSLLKGKPGIVFPDAKDATLTRMHSGSHSDYLYISGDNNEKSKTGVISVDQIRAISGFLSKTTGESKSRVIIIDGAESMNTNASNALLKNLEEPPHNTLIILISHNQANLLPTIRSRVQVHKFQPLVSDDCARIIKKSLQASDLIGEEDVALMADISEGRPGLALEWLEHNAAEIYRQWLHVVDSGEDENRQLERVAKFADELTTDKQTMHEVMEIFSTLLLLFIKRAAICADIQDAEEKRVIDLWRSRATPKEMVASWFLLKDQFSLVQKLHLEYKNTLITILLRTLRGQAPLDLI